MSHPNLTKLLIVTGCLAALAACSSKSDPQPTTTEKNTSRVTFENQSVSNRVYDVIWDGARVASVQPGAEHAIETTPGGHTLQWRFANTGGRACSNISTPQLVAGRSYRMWCRQ